MNPKEKELPGVALEKTVARIQQMMDPNSTVSHNEKLVDRVGNKRQFDVVIRGSFGGRPVLGVMECKDQSRKKGPHDVEAFAKKTENLGTNLRLMVSKKGFTEQALALAKHEHIGCLSLLPADPLQAGFSIGDMWYGVIRKWTDVRLIVVFASERPLVSSFTSEAVKWQGKLVVNFFIKELLTTHVEVTQEGEHTLSLQFDEVRKLEIDGREYPVKALGCVATRVCKKKRKWVSWSGDALYDWHAGNFTIPPHGTIVGSGVETDLSTWDDYDGEIPLLGKGERAGFVTVVLENVQKWDDSIEVPDLTKL